MARTSLIATIATAAAASTATANTLYSAAFVPPSPPCSPSSTIAKTATATPSQCRGLDVTKVTTTLGMSLAPTKDEKAPATNGEGSNFPSMDENGIYEVSCKEQHQALLQANPNKVVVMKFYAPWCRACKGLEPKFIQIRKDPKYERLPMVWAQMSIQHNKDFIKSIGVLALPSVHIYAGAEGLVENFPCGPSKVPILKSKLASTLNAKIDPKTLQLKSVLADSEIDCTLPSMAKAEPCAQRDIASKGDKTKISGNSVVVGDDTWAFLRNDVPYFKDFDEDEFNDLMKKAKLQTFEPGNVILRQGMPGQAFYVIDSGEVEVIVNFAMAGDPLIAPANYLGAAINHLGAREYFGERSLITGEPLAASIRATEKTRCFAFDVNDIPASSVLSGKVRPTSERLAQIDDKYGLDVVDLDYRALGYQARSANAANQARGSIYSPKLIPGVDTDDEEGADADADAAAAASEAEERAMRQMDIAPGVRVNGNDDMVINLLLRFQLIRSAARCFEYIIQTQPNWGDQGEQTRRSMLVSRLTAAQKEEFIKVFRLIDSDNNKKISLLELKRAMMSIGEAKTDEELYEMINKADASIDGNTEIRFMDFMGIMAEAEFYYLFMDTFRVLDKENIGFVTASDLDKALCGVRDLISDDRKSIIDVEDKNMLINYEQFARMLLGA